MRNLGIGCLVLGVLLVAGSATAQRPQPEDPNKARAREHYALGWEHMRAEAFERAAAEFQLATDFDPKLAMAWYGLGRAHMALRKYQQAILNLEECRTQLTTQGSRRFNNQMDANRARRDRLMELEDLRNQWLKGPQDERSQDMLRLIENEIKFSNDNLERERNVQFDEPVPSFVWLSLGSAYFRRERFDDAEEAYKAAIRADDTAAAAHNNLAVVYLLKGRQAEAQAHIRRAEQAGHHVDPELKAQVADRSGDAPPPP